jgi:hypothetical protein
MSGAKSLTGQSRTAGWAVGDVHPDYLCFDDAVASPKGTSNWPLQVVFLVYVNQRYNGAFWNKTPRERWHQFCARTVNDLAVNEA